MRAFRWKAYFIFKMAVQLTSQLTSADIWQAPYDLITM